MVKKGEVSTESGRPLPTSGRKKHGRKQRVEHEGVRGKGTKRAAEEKEDEDGEDSSSEEEEHAAAAKKRKMSSANKTDASASDSDDSLPPPAFGAAASSRAPAANGARALESTAAAAATAAPPGPSANISTTATRGSDTSASQRLESINARHPPTVGAVLRTVRPLQALTGVSTTELARLTQDVRRIGDEVEIAAVQAVIGGSPSSKKHGGGRGGRQTKNDTDREEGGIFGDGNARHRAVTAIVIAFAIAIDVLVLSELLHVIGGIFIAGTAASALSTDPPSSLLARSIHASLTPKARRPSQRVYDRTKILGTSLVSSMEALIGISRHDSQEMEEERHHPNIRPPRRSSSSPSIKERAELYVTHRLMGLTEPVVATASEANDAYEKAPLSSLTLREFISNDDGFHLAMAPAFFGFYAYFGALSALNEEVLGPDDEGKVVLPTEKNLSRFPADGPKPNVLLKSVAGASAGAMAAVFLSAGADPRHAADTCLDLTFGEVADYGGFGAALKGHRFEAIMKEKLEKIGRTSRFEESLLPVAVSGFDLLSMSGRLLDGGCMAKAARASATFPGLFQPVGWNGDGDDESRILPDNLLIDGGIRDLFGLNGLSILSPEKPKRIVNIVVGDFGSLTPGPSHMPKGIQATEVVSISLQNLPKCGPWAMENGPIAVEAARKAVAAVLDAPMHLGSEPGHYELHVDAIDFV